MKRLRKILEWNAFGVCATLAEWMGIPVHRTRLYFIYLSFFTFGSPVILYLFVAFWLNVRNYMRNKRRTVWDL